jgi:F420-dependent oxidoreductase-like protein
MTTFGVHTGLQHTTLDELVELWQRIESLGFDWISIWDHFYAADLTGNPNCLEAVSAHAALASVTSRVRCGSLVYCVGYRHPAVLAKSITTIDHISHGRADIGLGAGWSEVEYRAYGLRFPPVGERMDMLEEAAACVRGLLREERVTFAGSHFRLDDAQNAPRPVQAALPVWIGGGGEKRTLRIAAQYADGWNVPFVSPEQFAAKRAVLHSWCEQVGRDPSEIRCAVNLGYAKDDDDVAEQFANLRMVVAPGVLIGGPAEVAERVQQYVEAGADQVNLSLRAPWDAERLEKAAAALGLG